MSLFLIPRAHKHNEAQLLFFWWISYSQHLNCRINFSVVIANEQCLHLCKQSTCKVADEYDSWFNLSVISERGCVCEVWLDSSWSGHTVWRAVSCVNGAYLMLGFTHRGGVCRFSSGPAWLLAKAANQDTSYHTHTHPLWGEICSQITSSQQRVNDMKLESQLYKKSLMWENRRRCCTCCVESVHDKNQTYKFCCACALIGFDSATHN